MPVLGGQESCLGGTQYRTVTVHTYLNCLGPNYSACPKSSFRLQWFTGGRWRAVRAYLSPYKPGVDVDKTTVLTRVSVPVGTSRQFRLRIAATSTAPPAVLLALMSTRTPERKALARGPPQARQPSSPSAER